MEVRFSALENMVTTAAWSKVKVFVTGGNGFLGSWLVKRLLELEANVTCLIKEDLPLSVFNREGLIERVRLVPGVLEDKELLDRTIKSGNFDAVFHLGAQALVTVANRDPILTFNSNIRGSWNLLEACRPAGGVRAVIVASSDKAYGASSNLPYREEHALCGLHPYDVSKSCTDLIAQTYHHSYRLPVSVIRCGNIVGGGDLHKNRIVPETILALKAGRRPIIRSDGKYKRDFVYVEDVVDAYLKVAESTLNGKFVGEAWNVSGEKPVEVIEVVRLLQTLMNKEHLEPDVRGEATNEIREQYLDSQKIRRQLGWLPHCDLDAALRKTVEWYEENPI